MKNIIKTITSEKASRIITFLILAAIILIASETNNKSEYHNPYPIVKVVSYLYDNSHNSLQNIGYGSGVVINNKNQILTNFHVVSDRNTSSPADIFEVCYSEDLTMEPDCLYSAELISYDQDRDIAILQLNNGENPLPDFPKIKLSKKSPTISDNVKVLGFPDIGETTLTVTSGTVSGYSKDNIGVWIKFDSKTSYGGSGGALLNQNQELIGITSMVNASDIESLGYFKPISEIYTFIVENENKQPVTNVKAFEEMQRKIGLESFELSSKEYYHENPAFRIILGEKWLIKWIDQLDKNAVELRHKFEPIFMGIRVYEFSKKPFFDDFRNQISNDMDYASLLYKFSNENEYEFAGSNYYGKGMIKTIGNFGFDMYWHSDINIQSSSKRVADWHNDFLEVVNSMELESTEERKTDTFEHQISGMRFQIASPWIAEQTEKNRNNIVLYQTGNKDMKISIYHQELNEKSQINPDQFFTNQINNLSYDGLEIIEVRKTKILGQEAHSAKYRYSSGRKNMVEKLYRFYLSDNRAQEVSIYITSEEATELANFAIADRFLHTILIQKP